MDPSGRARTKREEPAGHIEPSADGVVHGQRAARGGRCHAWDLVLFAGRRSVVVCSLARSS